MNNTHLIITAVVLGIAVTIALVIYLIKKSHNSGGSGGPGSWKGLVLFDIDGTLTPQTNKNNTAVVQACLDAGYAVGVCTAGSGYTPQNVINYDWMPQNLYSFMSDRNFDTFNDVGNGYLNGKMNQATYDALKIPSSLTGGKVVGYKKGFALATTGKIYGIGSDNCMLLCDDDPNYRAGASAYNPHFTIVCANTTDPACNGGLKVENVVAGLNKCG